MTDRSKPSYPRLSATAWWRLRARFRQSIPNPVSAGFLATFFDTTTDSASNNFLRPLKALGLVDQDNRATERANRWRHDEDYPAVCEEIRDDIYPAELRDAQPCPNPDRGAVENWFSRVTGQGNAAVKQMAALYVLLCEATPRDSAGDGASSKRVAAKPLKSKQKALPANRRSKNGSDQNAELSTPIQAMDTPRIVDSSSAGTTSRQNLAPSLHIDIQIHISSDASGEQIDQIFKSMATHLFRDRPAAER